MEAPREIYLCVIGATDWCNQGSICNKLESVLKELGEV